MPITGKGYLGPKRPAMSKWAGIHFNKPAGMQDDVPPRLMASFEIRSTRNLELYRIHSIAFELSEGDTLVFIDYPQNQKHPTRQTDCNGITYKSQEFRVHSENLLKTNSAKFAEMLGPTYQFRVQRRRKLVNKLPTGIKYVLDLTPPSEGDELVCQVAELSLTPGIINWWGASILHRVDSWLVCGHDDVCTCSKSAPVKLPVDILPLDPERLLRMKAQSEDDLYETPDYRRIPDYCPIRHRNGIIRLLMLIEGKPAVLDSAPRVWTMLKLSKEFDCFSVIRDRVAQWIMHGPNTRFIEVLPEEALQIAYNLELPEVAQAAFRILVNELALEQADSQPKKGRGQTTIFGRRLGDLPDELSNIVQHAARELVARISSVTATLQNPEMFDYWDIKEWNQLRALEQLLVEESGVSAEFALVELRNFMEALVQEIVSSVNRVISNDIDRTDTLYKSIDQDRASYVQARDFETISTIKRRLNIVQQFLCSFTYNEFAWELDTLMFCGGLSKHHKSMALRYEDLEREVSRAIQNVVNDRPILDYTDAWAPYFGQGALENGIRQIRSPLIRLKELECSVCVAILPICHSWVRPDMEPPLNITRHLLLTLNNESEMKFLPLWAGGCDDGTGGVFEDQIPLTDMGPNGPGPSFHTGFSLPSRSSSVCGSMIEDLAELRVRSSTVTDYESLDVHDSISTVYHPDRVIADDVSVASSSFTMGASDYQDARFSVPVEGQGIASAVDMLVETTDSEIQSATDCAPASDDDTDFWNDASDSEDSVMTIEENHTPN
ncbi:hypothetical protein BGZ63DRAFT_353181 [Mariannaea sp. PMI_226]|nr:hypothetical protein BGZ63DRAFT_353181 [Mariannaea sp. PMI_226]